MDRTSTIGLVVLVTLITVSQAFGQTSRTQLFPYPDSTTRGQSVVAADGSLWAINVSNPFTGASKSGVSRFDGVTWRTYHSSDGLVNDTLASICKDKQGRIWVAGKRCVAYFDNSTQRFVSMPVEDSLSTVRDYLKIVCDSDGNIWAASFPKVIFAWRLNGTVPNYYSIQQLHRWDGRSWATFDLHDVANDTSDSGGWIVSLSVSPDGALWVVAGMYYRSYKYVDGLFKYHNGEWTVYNLLSGLGAGSQAPTASDIVTDGSGSAWILYAAAARRAFEECSSGTWWYDSTNIRVVRGTAEWAARDPRTGYIWMGAALPFDTAGVITRTGSGGVFVWDPVAKMIVQEIHGDEYYSASFDGATTWLVGSKGIYKIDAPSRVTEPLLDNAELAIAPNPMSSRATLTYLLPAPSQVTAHIVNSAGQATASLLDAYQSSGKHTLEISRRNLPSGSYRIILHAVASNGHTVEAVTNLVVRR